MVVQCDVCVLPGRRIPARLYRRSSALSSNPCLLMIMLLELPSRPRPPTHQQIAPAEDDTLVGQLVNLLCGVICKDTPFGAAFGSGGEGHAAGKTILIEEKKAFRIPLHTWRWLVLKPVRESCSPF